MTGALVALFLTLGFKESLLTAATAAKCTGVCALAVDKMWRTLIGMFLLFQPGDGRLIELLRIRCCSCMHCSLLPSYHP